MKGEYTIIVPSLKRVGPVNFAVDIGLEASKAGWRVRLLYLTRVVPRDDLGFASEVRRFSIADLWQLRGVVHTHCLRPDLLALAMTWNRKITLITTLHNFFLIDLNYLGKSRFIVQIAWQVWKRSLRCFDHVVCISEAMRDYYIQKLPKQKFDLIYIFRSKVMGLPPSQELLDWIADRRVLGDAVLSFVGDWTIRKNIQGLIDALSLTKSISLIVCGDGPLRVTLANQVRLHALQDRVWLAGRVDCPTSIVQCTDALILPSLAEGFPAVVIEAASVGVPSLMSDIAVHREVASVGFGYTFDHLQFSDFENAVQILRRKISSPSSELILLWSSSFTPRSGFKKYEDLILSNYFNKQDHSIF
jgi:glycosyltransferase involved in cell wall biosynthesis